MSFYKIVFDVSFVDWEGKTSNTIFLKRNFFLKILIQIKASQFKITFLTNQSLFT